MKSLDTLYHAKFMEYEEEQYSKADNIDQLMHRYPHLRAVYIDNIRLDRP